MLKAFEADSDDVWTGSLDNIKNRDGDVYGNFAEFQEIADGLRDPRVWVKIEYGN